MGILNNLRLAMRRAVISSQVESAPAKTLVMGLRPMRMSAGTEDEELAFEFAWKALFCEPRFSKGEVRDALVHGIYESQSLTVIEACMQQLQGYPNRADVAKAFLDVLRDNPESDLNEWVWLWTEKYFNRWTAPLPQNQTAGFLAQCEALNAIHPSKVRLFEKIRNRVINGGPPPDPTDEDYFVTRR